MRIKLAIFSIFTHLAFLALPANAEIQSCSNKVVEEINRDQYGFTGVYVVASEEYQDQNYHLIYLTGAGRPIEAVFKENSSVCELLIFNPLGDDVSYSSVMPDTVARKLSEELKLFGRKVYDIQ